ncbi:MAG TPA: hypothetical protein PKC43_06320 [Phycisphaerales bacterium]|nr:hypothetical protein [Phycisphaerales bacterium]HMP37047.1 hypothetical protein [Phycisphaerales bacterium]
MQLPPVSDLRRLRLELRLVPASHREDAMQVAWIAYLEGRDPAVAVNSWWAAERRRRRREVPEEIAHAHTDERRD